MVATFSTFSSAVPPRTAPPSAEAAVHGYPPGARSGYGGDLAHGAGPERPEQRQVDAVADEPHRPVGHGELHASGVIAGEGVAVPPLVGRVVFPGEGALGVGRVGAGGDGVVHVAPGVLVILAGQGL